MTTEGLREEIAQQARFSFARSGGPGGQNVNKVNSKVLLTIDPDLLTCLDDGQRERVKTKLQNRMNSDGELFIQIQEERSQLQNRERAVIRMTMLITDALRKQKRRRKTKPSKAAQQRRLDTKRKQSEKKQRRGKVDPD